MQHIRNIDFVRTIRLDPSVAGFHLDFSLGEEAPLFAPPVDEPLTYGVGYNSYRRRKALGLPYFDSKRGNRARKAWDNMMRRCYGKQRTSAYADCRVCRKWHDYQEFAAWYATQPYAGMSDAELDKDILDPLNTVYSPEHCTLAPKLVNLIFKSSQNARARFPRGVYEHSSKSGFVARISRFGSSTTLDRFDDPIAAFEAYKRAREAYGQELAGFYDGLIDERIIARLKNLSAHIRD